MTSGRLVVSRSPQRPADVVAEVPATTPEQVRAAVGRAAMAQRAWAGLAPADRAAGLGAAADSVEAAGRELAALVVREVGKPAAEAAGEVTRAVAILRYYAQVAFDPVGATYPAAGSGLAFTRRRPRGVAALITPWNFPLAIPVWKAAPALAYGNAALLKPAPEATGCALRLGELVAGHLPDGLFAVLPGYAEPAQSLVQWADLVSFTGSTAVGRQLAVTAAQRGIPAQCELGGLSAAVVLPDADLERAAGQIVGAAMGFAGQQCTATKRIIAVGDPDPLSQALHAAVARLRCGDPAAAGVSVGPVISEAARAKVQHAAAEAVSAGGQLLYGECEQSGDGWFTRPTIVSGLPVDTRLNREEVFGPICTLTSVADAETALALAEDSRYGLVTSLHTQNLEYAMSYVQQCGSDLVKVNLPTTGVDFYLPFGEQDSGDGGKSARDFYTSVHTVQLS